MISQAINNHYLNKFCHKSDSSPTLNMPESNTGTHLPEPVGLTDQNILKKPGGVGETPTIPSRTQETALPAPKTQKRISYKEFKKQGRKTPLKQLDIPFE